MQSHKYTLSAAALILAAAFAFATEATAQAKEGTWNDTFAGVGTYKAIPVGKDRLLLVLEGNYLSVSSNPMFNHLTWHFLGLGDFTKGVGQAHGYSVATDPSGDQFVQSFMSEKYTLSQKSFKVSTKLEGGTGKFAGITGTGTVVVDGGMFKATEKGTSIVHGTRHYSYKLP